MIVWVDLNDGTPWELHTPTRTSGMTGPSVNLSQQSPFVWVWASGSKHTSSGQNANALQGRFS